MNEAYKSLVDWYYIEEWSDYPGPKGRVVPDVEGYDNPSSYDGTELYIPQGTVGNKNGNMFIDEEGNDVPFEDQYFEKTNPLNENKMNKETLRMQMLSGIITESEYKEKLEEIGIGAVLGTAAVAALAKKAYDKYKNYSLKKGMEETGNEKKGTNGVTAKEFKSKDGNTYWGVFFQDSTRDQGYEKPRILLFTQDKIDKVLNTKLQGGDPDEDRMADNFDKRLGQFTADKVIMLEGKKSLNENFVGMGMVGNIFDREKTDYELAFEHFTKGTSLNEMEDEMPEAPSHEETDANQVYEMEGEDVMPKFRRGVLRQLIAYAEESGSSQEAIDDLKAALDRIEAEIEAEKNKKPLPR
jgi:hypothetical protein